jgi:hypothetical protein
MHFPEVSQSASFFSYETIRQINLFSGQST